MSNRMNRRDLLKSAGLAGAGLLVSPLLQRWAAARNEKPRKILFFTRSQGYEHGPITRPRGNPQKLAFAENFMVNLGREHNMEVTCTKDGSVFTEQGLAPFDLIMFYTTGRLDEPGKEAGGNNHPMPPGGKDTFLNAIAAGKGFLGVHSATDTFHSTAAGVDPYIKMIGGEFVHHYNQQNAKIEAVAPDWGPIHDLKTFTKREEWYILNNLAPDMHVLLVQDTKSMEQPQYTQLAPYPETWARMHGKGRVFYSSMGHREDVWTSPQFHQVLLGGLQWATGNAEGEPTPNIKQVTPDAPMRAPDA